MENQIIDYYNNFPTGVNVINELNEEYNQLENEKNKIQKELEFYQSIFKTHINSAIFNLRIKTINGEKIWIDKIKIYTDYDLLNKLDEDEEVKEWKKPIRCER
tara:strand:+ start:157 stop:465 length:309 start_codon:yes stop_codon:yes gene_type:complete